MENKPRWRQLFNGSWQYVLPLAVIGTVTYVDKYWVWSARVMEEYRIDGKAIQGKATTLEGSKKIVEIVCKETGTDKCLM